MDIYGRGGSFDVTPAKRRAASYPAAQFLLTTTYNLHYLVFAFQLRRLYGLLLPFNKAQVRKFVLDFDGEEDAGGLDSALLVFCADKDNCISSMRSVTAKEGGHRTKKCQEA